MAIRHILAISLAIGVLAGKNASAQTSLEAGAEASVETNAETVTESVESSQQLLPNRSSLSWNDFIPVYKKPLQTNHATRLTIPVTPRPNLATPPPATTVDFTPATGS
jgi:hypothetical protein